MTTPGAGRDAADAALGSHLTVNLAGFTDAAGRRVIDAASARDLGLFLAVVAPTADAPVERPVTVLSAAGRSVVMLRASLRDDGAWEFAFGEDLIDVAPPDEPEAIDPRL